MLIMMHDTGAPYVGPKENGIMEHIFILLIEQLLLSYGYCLCDFKVKTH